MASEARKQQADTVASLLRQLAAILDKVGRKDLAESSRASAARIVRPATVVCVVGEFKQGKSSLVNALLGEAVCPVDDDLATSALTLVYFAPERVAHVRRLEEGASKVEQIESAHVAQYVSESGNPGNERRVERVDVGLPHPLLARGLALVDTPGAGGLGAGNATATQAFLPYADGLIFVTSAMAELSRPEIEFMKRARALCPVVICALTKIDVAADWRRIAELDRAHLTREGIDATLVPLAAPLRVLASRSGDAALDPESGYPVLETLLEREIVAPAKQRAIQRGVSEGVALSDQIIEGLQAELRILQSPEAAAASVVELERATAHLEHLRGPGARWSLLIGDRMTDLSNAASYQLRGAIRTISRDVDAEIEGLDSAAEWEEMSRALCERVADAVAGVFNSLEDGSRSLQQELVALLRDDPDGISTITDVSQVDIARLWRDVPFGEQGPRVGTAAGQAMTGLRGGYSGLFMFSILSRFLPAGAAALMMSNPVSLALGVVFAGQSLIDANKRKLAARRQAARGAVRQFLDDVQFEVSNDLSEAARTIQRQLRDEFSERIGELQRTLIEAVQRAKQNAQQDAAARARRQEELGGLIADLEAHKERLLAARAQ